MRFEARSVGRVSITNDQRIVLEHANLKGQDYSGRKLIQFCTVGCRLEGCRFDKTNIAAAQFGSGREVSEYVECVFDGTRMDIGAGGYARFVRCSFRDVDIRHWICFTVEMIDCIFSGRMEKAIFNGTVPKRARELLGRDRNEFRGNDFSAMDFIDVGFRTGVDLTLQRLPSGPAYLYLPDAAAAVERANAGLAEWQDLELREPALWFVKTIADEIQAGQKQMLLRADDYFGITGVPREAIDHAFGLLRGEVQRPAGTSEIC